MKKHFEWYESVSVQQATTIMQKMRSLDDENKRKALISFKVCSVQHVLTLTSRHLKEVCLKCDPFAFGVMLELAHMAGNGKLAPFSYLDWTLKKSGCKTVFLESPSFAQWLFDQKFEIDAACLKFPWPAFSFAFPSNLVVNKIPMKGFATTFESRESDFPRSIFEMAREVYQAGNVLFQEVFREVMDFVESVNVEDFIRDLPGNKERQFIGVIDLPSSPNFFRISTDNLLKLLSMDPGSTSAEMTEGDRGLYTYQRLMASFLCYAQAFGHCILDGLPEGLNDKTFTFARRSATLSCLREGIRCGEPVENDGCKVSMHARGGCWVHYTHSRYLKSHGGEPWLGYRKGCIVGGEIDPKTATDPRPAAGRAKEETEKDEEAE